MSVTFTTKEQSQINDLKRLDNVLLNIDAVAQDIRMKHLQGKDYTTELGEYHSYLEVLWRNLLRPKLLDKTPDQKFVDLSKIKDKARLLEELKRLNDDLYVLKEAVPAFNSTLKVAFMQEHIDFPELEGEDDSEEA